MKIRRLSEFQAGDVSVAYFVDDESARVGLRLLPAGMEGLVPEHRVDLRGVKEIESLGEQFKYPPAWELESLVHVAVAGEACDGGFAQGQSLRGGSVDRSLVLVGQELSRQGQDFVVITLLRSKVLPALEVEHVLAWKAATGSLEVTTVARNAGKAPLRLDRLTSFTLGFISPFAAADDPGALLVHRFRGGWSMEGRHEARSIEELALERSWVGHAVRCERFGQNGTKPTTRWFPLVAVEDRKRSVLWGASLAWPASWNMELYRKDDFLCLAGGLADRETGHWSKLLEGGESLESPVAHLACVRGDLDELCARLSSASEGGPPRAHEADLPIVVNEWCTSWGNPTEAGLVALARAASSWKPRYLVIDAGWYREGEAPWDRAHGDWRPSAALFPQGLAATCAAIRAEGMVPGLWFELETAGSSSRVWSREELFLRRDGALLQSGERRFFDFRLAAVHAYLEERVLDLIEGCGIGYLKIDYNETTGWGADGNESEGEAIRQQALGFMRLLGRLRERFPDLVIENCSSGAMRADPLTVSLCDQSSFSDAHETADIPVIAANLQRLLPARKTQVWAVLRDTDGEGRLLYSLAATFLGRMCLSGDLMSLDAAARAVVDRAVALYRVAAPIIAAGFSRRQGPEQTAYRALTGWQAVLREGLSPSSGAPGSSGQVLLVLHSFAAAPAVLRIELPRPGLRLSSLLAPRGLEPRIEGSVLIVENLPSWCGAVALLEAT